MALSLVSEVDADVIWLSLRQSIIGDNLAAHEILSAKLQQDALSLSLVVQQTQVTASNSLEIAQQHAVSPCLLCMRR